MLFLLLYLMIFILAIVVPTFTNDGLINTHITLVWRGVISWMYILISLTIYFFFGTKLRLYSNHIQNYLSICGVPIIALIFVLSPTYFRIFIQLPFLVLLTSVYSLTNYYVAYVTSVLIAIFPSIMVWLGILYKSKKVNLNQ